ncbi:MAG: TonB-dependent receptor [Chitinophagales bacterium]|nr:TonB-dependent receptor [Bacteroidota bacterium]
MTLKKYILLLGILYLGFLPALHAQTTLVKGSVTDKETGEGLILANVVVKNTTIGVQTDYEGDFELKVNQNPPFTIVATYIGYDDTEVQITQNNQSVKISMLPSGLLLDAVEIKSSRITEKQRESPRTVEALDLIAIKETPAASFYDGLGSLKGVDLTSASLGFKIINTRGFNSTSPVRSLQLIDGVDNQAPGLNFSLGNFMGASELDVQRVEIIAGASTALYGPNAFNGVINMNTKDPFYQQGLSVMAKMGERNLMEAAVRYAHAINNRWAYKVNLSLLSAKDWIADNAAEVYRPEDRAFLNVGENNPGGYDAVNRYGDENLSISGGANNYTDLTGLRLYPGLGIFHRTGYWEEDLVDYNTENLKAAAAIHYRIKDETTLIAAYNFGLGTTVYQGDNRYSLKDISFHQARLEVNKRDKFFVRAYHTYENAGKSYDVVSTAIRMQDIAKTNNAFSQDYFYYWNNNVVSQLRQLEGFPPITDSGWYLDPETGLPGANYAIADSVMAANMDQILAWHAEARAYADNNASAGELPLPQRGTAAFDSLFNLVISTTPSDKIFTLADGSKVGGTLFYDRSSLTHFQGEYKFSPEFAHFTVGSSYRIYTPDSRGTIFSDTADVKIRNSEFGVYGAAEKRFLDKHLILTATARADKNQNFDWLFSPAASAVYLIDDNNSVRLSFSSAIRNPTLADQYLYFGVGRAILLGNLSGVDTLVSLNSVINFFNTSDRDTLEYISAPAVRPEQVRTLETGFKGNLWENLFVDVNYYFSWYKYFLGYKIGAALDFIDENDNFPGVQVYRVATNSSDQVTTQGFSIGLNYFLGKFYAINGNYSWNKLDRQGSVDPIIPAFNTPENKFNLGVSGRNIIGPGALRNWGFNVNYKWIEGFLFEGSPQFTGNIPTYDMLDVQLNYTVPKIKTTFKLGASNVLNNLQYQTYGGPRIGRMAYFSVVFDNDKL